MTGPVSLIFTILISIFLSGCAATSNHQALKDTRSSLKEIKAFLSPHQKMVWYGKTEYKKFGKMTANAIKAAFSKFSNTIYISENCTGRECFNMSYQRKVHLLCGARNPTLVGPSHRGSGIPDKIEIKILQF
jgi:hypothetical protein